MLEIKCREEKSRQRVFLAESSGSWKGARETLLKQASEQRIGSNVIVRRLLPLQS